MKQENNTGESPENIVEKSTPIEKDYNWIIKWLASIASIIGAMLTAADITPWNVAFGFLGLSGWTYIGCVWQDRALIIMNAYIAGAFSLTMINTIKDWF